MDISAENLGEFSSSFLSDATFAQYIHGDRNMDASAQIRNADLGFLIDARQIVDTDAAECCRAGLLLLFNDLDGSHAISQGIHSAEGSYWHGIMHRIEGDFSNAKYWHRLVGDHPTNSHLEEFVRRNLSGGSDQRISQLGKNWDAGTLIDLCRDNQSPSSKSFAPIHQIVVEQWKQLFLHCFQLATGEI